MNTKDLRQKNKTELLELVQKLEKELTEVTMSILQRKEKNVKKPSALKRRVARVKTILREKEQEDE